MSEFSVNFLIRDWVSINVFAPDEQTAIENARKKMDNLYDKSGIDCNDGRTEYVGVFNNTILDRLDN